jgi:hypothetical protein
VPEPPTRRIDYARPRTTARTVALRVTIAAVLGFALVAAVVLFPVARARLDLLSHQRLCASVGVAVPVSITPGVPPPVHASWQTLMATIDGGYRPAGATLFVGLLRRGNVERLVGVELTGLDRLGDPVLEVTALRPGTLATPPSVTERDSVAESNLVLPVTVVESRVAADDAATAVVRLERGGWIGQVRVTLTEAGTIAVDRSIADPQAPADR